MAYYSEDDAEKAHSTGGVPKGTDGKVLTKQDLTQQINALNQYKSTLQAANTSYRPIVSYTNTSGNKAIAMQLTKKELSNAIQAYQVNPDIYKGWSPAKLQIMGLNPNMSQGKAGATKTGWGYVPTSTTDPDPSKSSWGQPGQKNWTSALKNTNFSNFYVSPLLTFRSPFSSMTDLQGSGNTPAEKKSMADEKYINVLQTQMDTYKSGKMYTGYNDGTYNYLAYKLALFKYNNGLTSVKPTPVAPPLSKAGKAEMAKLQTNVNTLNTAIANANAKLKTQEAQVAIDKANQTSSRRNLQDARDKLTTAQQAQGQAMKASTGYDTNLANTLEQQYNQQYYHTLESSIQDNTAFNPSDLINPSVMYAKNSIAGTGVIAPKANSVPSGIEFVNGNPQIISSALQARQTSVGSAGGPTTGASTKSAPAPAPAPTPPTAGNVALGSSGGALTK